LDDKPASTKGGKATVALMTGSEKKVAQLEPAGGNKFKTKGTFVVKPEARRLRRSNFHGETRRRFNSP
jgi:hypothetical protein